MLISERETHLFIERVQRIERLGTTRTDPVCLGGIKMPTHHLITSSHRQQYHMAHCIFSHHFPFFGCLLGLYSDMRAKAAIQRELARLLADEAFLTAGVRPRHVKPDPTKPSGMLSMHCTALHCTSVGHSILCRAMRNNTFVYSL
jgi:hypothetical protein